MTELSVAQVAGYRRCAEKGFAMSLAETVALADSHEALRAERDALAADLERILGASGQCAHNGCNADTVIDGIMHMRVTIERLMGEAKDATQLAAALAECEHQIGLYRKALRAEVTSGERARQVLADLPAPPCRAVLSRRDGTQLVCESTVEHGGRPHHCGAVAWDDGTKGCLFEQEIPTDVRQAISGEEPTDG